MIKVEQRECRRATFDYSCKSPRVAIRGDTIVIVREVITRRRVLLERRSKNVNVTGQSRQGRREFNGHASSCELLFLECKMTRRKLVVSR
jgi:hypothetical protein